MMNNLAIKRRDVVPELDEGRVVGRDDGFYLVETGTGLCRARKAVSCLVEPEIDDLVLVTRSRFDRGHVLAVLERDSDANVTLSFEADLNVKTPGGRVGIVARDGLDLVSEKDLNLLSAELGLTAAEAKINIESLSFWGGVLEGNFRFVKLIADRFESFLDKFTRIAKFSYRHTEELDQTRCGRFHVEADRSLQLRAGFAQMTAKEDVHIDGERVHIG